MLTGRRRGAQQQQNNGGEPAVRASGAREAGGCEGEMGI
jgi:hypothetical protein